MTIKKAAIIVEQYYHGTLKGKFARMLPTARMILTAAIVPDDYAGDKQVIIIESRANAFYEYEKHYERSV